METTAEKEYPVETSKYVAGRSKPTMIEDVGLHPYVSATLQTKLTPPNQIISLWRERIQP
jgi:hypothetical protein